MLIDKIEERIREIEKSFARWTVTHGNDRLNGYGSGKISGLQNALQLIREDISNRKDIKHTSSGAVTVEIMPVNPSKSNFKSS